MSNKRKNEQGFTAVELIVALVVGVLLLGSAYQLYTSVTTSAGDSQRQAQASNAAYLLMRQYQADPNYAKDPCTPKAATTVTMPSGITLPGATATVTVICPTDSAEADISKISVTVSYNNTNSRESVNRAIFTESP